MHDENFRAISSKKNSTQPSWTLPRTNGYPSLPHCRIMPSAVRNRRDEPGIQVPVGSRGRLIFGNTLRSRESRPASTTDSNHSKSLPMGWRHSHSRRRIDAKGFSKNEFSPRCNAEYEASRLSARSSEDNSAITGIFSTTLSKKQETHRHMSSSRVQMISLLYLDNILRTSNESSRGSEQHERKSHAHGTL